MNKTDVVRQYRDKHPDWPNLKLARVILKKEPRLFNTVEHVRSTLRQIEGKSGGKKYKVRVTHERDARPYNPYKLPASDETSYEPYILRGHKRVVYFQTCISPIIPLTQLQQL